MANKVLNILLTIADNCIKNNRMLDIIGRDIKFSRSVLNRYSIDLYTDVLITHMSHNYDRLIKQINSDINDLNELTDGYYLLSKSHDKIKAQDPNADCSGHDIMQMIIIHEMSLYTNNDIYEEIVHLSVSSEELARFAIRISFKRGLGILRI